MNGFDEFAGRLDALAAQLSGPALKSTLTTVGKEMQGIAESSASARLGGDAKFSGWAPRLDTKVKVGANFVVMSPTRQSAGPWTVAERGRNQGDAGGFAGPGINTRTGLTARTRSGGVRRVRARQGRRWNGRTAGKRVAGDAQKRIETVIPKRIETLLITEATRKADLS